MKEVGICSLYYKSKNYGGLLQSYAMIQIITKLGYSCEQIRISREISFITRIRRIIDKGGITPKLVFTIVLASIQQKRKSQKNRQVEEKISVRTQKFRKFEEEIAHSKKVYTLETIKDVTDQYHRFFCGSDQIWNGWFAPRYIYIYSLQFVPDNKQKISYAASIGSDDIPKSVKKKLYKGVFRLNAISVREKSALELFPVELRKRMEVVLDPTLLLKANEWREIATSSFISESYIFCYFLGTDLYVRQVAREIAKKMGLKIVTNPYILGRYEECDKDFGDIRLFDAGPREFLALMDNAELVLTDSFHACVFSLQFQKNFFVFERKPGNRESSMHSRIRDFLETFHLENRLISYGNIPQYFMEDCNINFEEANGILDRERKKSMAFLQSALKGK